MKVFTGRERRHQMPKAMKISFMQYTQPLRLDVYNQRYHNKGRLKYANETLD